MEYGNENIETILIVTCNNMYWSHKYNVKQKKPKKNICCDFINTIIEKVNITIF